ncbi:hypothetical protein BDY21DRAFT_362491 [Lineolata rhizophorae]|uniref:Uncharacterized protein n=1 Tax=Lineolata rhizophorae TaxID=578093 RepID=A0A6A6P6B5_9PEZI|nr:hypothetical protein BDY21DRAFT_362491 [Lineolata rhizophorae]
MTELLALALAPASVFLLAPHATPLRPIRVTVVISRRTLCHLAVCAPSGNARKCRWRRRGLPSGKLAVAVLDCLVAAADPRVFAMAPDSGFSAVASVQISFVVGKVKGMAGVARSRLRRAARAHSNQSVLELLGEVVDIAMGATETPWVKPNIVTGMTASP